MAKIASKSKPPRRDKPDSATKPTGQGKGSGGKTSAGGKSAGGSKSFGGSKSTDGAKTVSGSKTPGGSKPSGFEKFSEGSNFNSPVKVMTDQLILELLLEDVFEEPTDYGAIKIQSLKKAGVLSEQPGVLVTMEDGTAYEILIKKVK